MFAKLNNLRHLRHLRQNHQQLQDFRQQCCEIVQPICLFELYQMIIVFYDIVCLIFM